ncbi:unnamed protein product, partial [marine sediment metagenome]
FNETTNNCKVALILNTTNAPRSLFYRFTLVANRSVISHINKSVNYEYTLNLSANQTENYSLTYNYSDLAPYIQSGVITIKQGIWNDYFYQRIRTTKRIAVNKTIVIDPYFGYLGTGASIIKCDDIWGSMDAPASSGIADNISVYLRVTAGTHDWQCALYNYNETLLAITEERSLSGNSFRWEVFNFSGSPSLTAGENYSIVTWCSHPNGEVVYIANLSGHRIYADDSAAPGYNNWANPISWDVNATGTWYKIYCYYTVSGWSNSCPSVDNEYPVNTSID